MTADQPLTGDEQQRDLVANWGGPWPGGQPLTGDEHRAVSVYTADGIPFVRCSCSTTRHPQSAVWLSEHTPNGGVGELRAVVARQAAEASRCAVIAPMSVSPPRCELPRGHAGQHRAFEVFWNGPAEVSR